MKPWGLSSRRNGRGPFSFRPIQEQAMAHSIRSLLVVTTLGVFVGFALCGDDRPKKETAEPAAKSSGFKERFRFNFSVLGPFQTEPIINDFVTVDEPFNFRRKDGEAATGVLRRTAEGGLHFKGEVSHSGRSAVFDAPVELRMVEHPKAGPAVFLGHLSSAQQRGASLDVFDLGFSLSLVEEHVRAGLGLGVSGKRDQVIVVPGPQAEKQRPSEWFASRLKAENVLTADQETWVLFRSQQLNRTIMWIERIERDENT
ncbi:MAG: hypothetical protein L0211_22620, partial [Planctomycetaceae bacterium]|nr:hypothetical protein [Planctomycetaceae bacterium]